MAVGMSAYLANKFFDAVCNNTSFAIGQVYIRLHTGDPGANGTANVASDSTRKAVSFANATAGTCTSDAQLQWTSAPVATDYTHYTAWDSATTGNFLWSGVITADPVAVGDTFTIPVGDIDLAITLAA